MNLPKPKPFGLDIRSVIPLPGCVEADGAADVSIRYGAVPDALPGAATIRACTQARPGQFLLVVDQVARYLVEDGSLITIQPAAGAPDAEIRLVLMGSVWSALLLQRGLLPIHGSAVRVNGRAIVLAGPSGNGKSTLAAALHESGHSLLADELCALAIGANGSPLLLPGFPQILLWGDALRALKLDHLDLVPVRASLKKYILPCPAAHGSKPLPLERIYILGVVNTPSFSLTPLAGMRKIHALIDHTYRVHHVAGLGLERDHFRLCAGVAAHVQVKRVERPGFPFDLASLVRHVTGDFR